MLSPADRQYAAQVAAKQGSTAAGMSDGDLADLVSAGRAGRLDDVRSILARPREAAPIRTASPSKAK